MVSGAKLIDWPMVAQLCRTLAELPTSARKTINQRVYGWPLGVIPEGRENLSAWSVSELSVVLQDSVS
jgi:hypothetical protein